MDFTFTITDQGKLDGLQKACDLYNASQAGVEGFVPLTIQGYVAFVMNSAMDSYAQTYVVQPSQQLAELQAAGVKAAVLETPVSSGVTLNAAGPTTAGPTA